MKLSSGCAEGAGGPLLRVSDWRGVGGPPRIFLPRLEKELHRLHAALSLEEFWRATIRVLNAALPNLFVAVCLQDIQIVRPMIVLLNRRVKGTTEYWRRHFELCPAGPLIQAHPEMELLRITDQLDGVDWHQTGFCRELMRDQGWHYAAILVLRDQGRFIGTVSVQRSRAQGDLSGSEMNVLARLHGHFEAAARRLLHADAELTAGRAVKQLWDRLPVAAMLLDWDLIPRYHNPAARDLCALWNRGKAARALSSRAVFAGPPLIQEACRQLKEQSSHSLIEDADPGLHLAWSLDHPAMPELRAHLFLTEVKCGSGGKPLFLVEFEHRTERPDNREEGGEPVWPSLSNPGERQVIELLRQGATNAELAERLQLSLSKVKKMLSRIFRKLGVSSRARLMALARTGASKKQTAECCANGGKGKANDR